MSYVNGRLGYWMSSPEAAAGKYPQQQGEDSVDVAIIGGGLTGLWAAYYVKKLEPSLSVAVYEAEQVGYGASGRNGGWVSALVPGNRKKFAQAGQGGLEGSKALQREFITSVDTIMSVLNEEGIKAEQHKGGALSAARTPAGLNRLIAKRKTDLAYGLDDSEVQLLSREDLRSRINVDGAYGGIYYPGVAKVNPAKMVHGLAAVVSAKGVDIYENSRVLGADRGLLTLPKGEVRAGMTFICTEGYSAPFLGKRRLIPINSSMLVTQQLDQRAWGEVGWNGGECLNDSAHTFIYAQRTSDGRIAIGGRGRPYIFGSGTGGEGSTAPATVKQLLAKLESFFPGIAFQAAHAWSGVLGVTRDWNGSVSWNAAEKTGSSVGYAGHGVTSAFVGGRTLAELALDRKTERTSLPWVGYSARKWEPEPIRWLGVHAMYRLFGVADSWEEARNAQQTSLIAKFGSRLAGLHE